MPRKKPVRRDTGSQEVVYTEAQWTQLTKLRQQAINLMATLESTGVTSLVHGSLSRGDVSESSDIDVYLPLVIPSFTVELALTQGDYQIIHRELVHATPFHAIKAHIYLPNNSVVTFPLTSPSPIELEFYRFGGSLGRKELEEDLRVPGVDKRLMLIEPTQRGHLSTPVVGNEELAAKKVGVNLKIIEERVKILMRRDTVGRTGVYLKRPLGPDETFESVLKHVADRDPVVRRRVQKG
jgi:predicted nucleotidyltransferase